MVIYWSLQTISQSMQLPSPPRIKQPKTTAEAIYNHFILNYGIPTKLHSDQGANFESEIINELCHLTGITKTRTTAYHPMGNGQTERYNRTLLNMLGTLDPSKQDWKKYLPSLVYAYNCTMHETTKISPFELMFGRKAKLPIDIRFEAAYSCSGSATTKATEEYIEDLRDRMAAAQRIAKQHSEDSQRKQKRYFDKKARASQISVGDTVLVKILAYEGKHKIADKFEEDLYHVMEQLRSDIPVFKIRSVKGVEKTLHRNHLLPVEVEDTAQEAEELDVGQRPKPKRRASLDKAVVTHESGQDRDASTSKGNLEVPLENQDRRDTDSEFLMKRRGTSMRHIHTYMGTPMVRQMKEGIHKPVKILLQVLQL